MPLEMLVTGRIATLGGEAGFGWVEAIGIRDGRIAFAGTEIQLETRADPFTERITLEPDQVVIPGLTDAHLHLASAGIALHQVDLGPAATLEDGLAAVRAVHERLSDPDAWLQGHGWNADQWGRWPTAADLERVAPGRRVALWSHDHHGLVASARALGEAGIEAGQPDPAGGVIRWADDGTPEGVLLEAATKLVSTRIPAATQTEVEAGLIEAGRELIALGVVACHDPGGLVPDPDLAWSYPAYARLGERGSLPVRVHACLRQEALGTAEAGGLRSGLRLGADPDGRATVGWLKLFADGALGSQTAKLLADVVSDPDRPVPPDRRRGVWVTEPEELAELARRAAAAGIATQIHAIGDAAARAALDALEPLAAARIAAGGAGPMPRLEHVQLLDPADRPRFAAAGIAASVQPVHLRSDAAQARRAWGVRAERSAYAWASIEKTGAVLAFGTDAPVESYDPWPGLAMAVLRDDPSWAAGTPPFGPNEAISLDRAIRAACLDPAISAGEHDRGRLTVGQRADLIVIPASSLDEPPVRGGPLATTRPDLVMVDGKVVFER